MNIIPLMPISAFVVQVHSAESLVADLRQRFDATAQQGVPAHITLLVPFMDPRHITPEVLDRAQQALAKAAPFSFSLVKVARFPTTTYLAPEPSAPFVDMTMALAEAFPDFPPYGGEHQQIVPHLTAAHGSASEADEAEAELRLRLGASGPIAAECHSVVLLENSTGLWKEMHRFQLPPGKEPG